MGSFTLAPTKLILQMYYNEVNDSPTTVANYVNKVRLLTHGMCASVRVGQVLSTAVWQPAEIVANERV